MQNLILPFSENDVDILAFISRLRQLNKTFRIEPVEQSQLDDPRIVWEVPEPDEDWQKLGLSSWNDEWTHDEEWNDFYQQTKPTFKHFQKPKFSISSAL